MLRMHRLVLKIHVGCMKMIRSERGEEEKWRIGHVELSISCGFVTVSISEGVQESARARVLCKLYRVVSRDPE